MGLNQLSDPAPLNFRRVQTFLRLQILLFDTIVISAVCCMTGESRPDPLWCLWAAHAVFVWELGSQREPQGLSALNSSITAQPVSYLPLETFWGWSFLSVLQADSYARAKMLGLEGNVKMPVPTSIQSQWKEPDWCQWTLDQVHEPKPGLINW